MIDLSGHLRSIRRDVGFDNPRVDLEINCCGYQYFDIQNFVKKREHGRLDYQIIYIYKGKAEFFLNDKLQHFRAGDIVLYHPHERQYYKYLSASKTEVYWIHFTGNKCEELLKRFFLDHDHLFVGEQSDLCSVFKEIIFELQLQKSNYAQIILKLFELMLLLINRYLKNDLNALLQNKRLDKLILALNDKYAHDWSIAEMAKICNMSSSNFMHFFKAQKGISAKKFLLKLRLDKAKEMILHENLNFQEISSFTGFKDPLYFSRVFTREIGVSPSKFHKLNGGS